MYISFKNKDTYKVGNLVGLRRYEKQSTIEEKITLKSKETWKLKKEQWCIDFIQDNDIKNKLEMM